MFMFRSKHRQRRFSNDLNICKQINFHPDKINFQAVSYTLLIIFTSLSSRYGKWILFAYSIIFTIAFTTSLYTYIQNYFYNKWSRFQTEVANRLLQIKNGLRILLINIDKIEQEYMKLNNISATLNQIVFFTICERVLLQNQNVTALFSLMFYNVLSYCISYLRQLCSSTNWSPYINIANHSNIKHLAMTATKLVLEVTKGVTFAITIVFMLFVLCVEQKMHHYQPTKLFTTLTFIYYLVTEKMFAEFFPVALSYFQFSYLENLETLWAPVLSSIISQCLSFSFVFILFVNGYTRAALIAFYLNVYLNYKKLTKGSWKLLHEETKVVCQFRYATKSELENFEDVCAVCLGDMKQARITPCHHIFHTDCLRRCLSNCDRCPVCKRELTFS